MRLCNCGRRQGAAGYVEVAYHSLLAAMHCAQSAADVDRLREVAKHFRDMLRALDERQPMHKLSSESSLGRGMPNIFESADRTAEITIPAVEAKQLVQEEQKHVA